MATLSTGPLRLGVIGAGARLRQVLGQLLAAAPAGRIVVTAAHDTNPEALLALRKVCGGDFETVKAEEELTRHAKVDWVFIGSWNVFHARQAVVALQAGKNVFCEKPLATTLEDCLAVRDAVKKSGRIFAFGLVLRYSPLYRKIHELVTAGRIGRIISLEFNETLGFNHGGYIFGNWRRRSANSGSHLLEKCCHDLDLVNWITGSLPARVASFGGRDFFVPANAHQVERIGPNAEGKPAYGTWADPGRVSPFSEGVDIVDNQVAILEYANGVRAAFHTNCNAGLPERRMYLCGTEGSLRADATTGIIELQRIGHDSKIERIDTGAAGGHMGGDEMMAQGLAGTLLEGHAPLASVEEGVQSCAVAFAIDRAMTEGRVVDLDSWWKTSGIGLEDRKSLVAAI
ncbi:MAG: Gfo/Idh/MocA family oxidoreductase [Methylacidiphilales bacterium]|nr:Gfo/Idh/MocA family oxidoreductase [Candidatus Methylacidiphilales bacterium]